MIIKFSERFSNLINETVARTFMKTKEEYDAVKGYSENLPISEDGFITQYCKE